MPRSSKNRRTDLKWRCCDPNLLLMFISFAFCCSSHVQEIASLRALLDLPCPDDVTVYRFLRGHKFDQMTAAKQLNHTLHWRKQYGLDELRKKAEKMEQKQFPFADKVLAVHPHKSVKTQRRGEVSVVPLHLRSLIALASACLLRSQHQPRCGSQRPAAQCGATRSRESLPVSELGSGG